MDRKAYNQCLLPYMKAPAEDQAERRLHFCIGAKVCSGKSANEEEARAACLIPKPVKIKASPGKPATCEKQAVKLAECVVDVIATKYKQEAMNINSVGQAIAVALMECTCQGNQQ